MRLLLVIVYVVTLPIAAAAQVSAPATDETPWHIDFSFMNGFDGNIGHDVDPIRSYGVAPGASVSYEGDAFAFGYDVALNSYTGTDEWDRVSHGLHAISTRRLGRVRFETGAEATWKGSSEDRELANEYGVSERLVVKTTDATRVIVSAAYRYKQYSDDPTTSGPSPYVAAKFDRRFGEQRLTFGYKYQMRLSEEPRDRYRRHAYSVAFSMPIDLPGDELSFEFEYRPQTYYQRLIRVGDVRELRQDRRFLLGAAYERPVGPRVNLVWFAGYEARDSNDPDKVYRAPSIAMAMRYRWR